MKSSPWAKLTTSMMPKISVSPEAMSARIMPVMIPLTVWMISCSRRISMLDAQVAVDDCVVRGELGRRGMVTDGSLFEEIDALTSGKCQGDVLLDQQNGHPITVEHVDDRVDLRYHARHQPFRRLVEQDDLGLEHHGAGDGEHLLLAA